MPGIDGDRCGSLARIGFPVAVRLPPITHELEPIPGKPLPMMSGSPSMPWPSAVNTAPAAAIASTGTSPAAPVPLPPVPFPPLADAVVVAGAGVSTIGRCSANGYAG